MAGRDRASGGPAGNNNSVETNYDESTAMSDCGLSS